MGALKNRSERSENKVHGAQRPRHIKSIGEEVSTAQRSYLNAQQIIRGGL